MMASGVLSDPKRVACVLSWVFLAYAVAGIIIFAVLMPPTMVADEFSHAARADQLSRGWLVMPRTNSQIDGAVYGIGKLLSSIPFHPEVKVTEEMARQAASLSWSTPDHEMYFPNTAQHGPLLYAPQVIGIWLGKAVNLSPVWTLLLARLINGFIAVAIGFAALRQCRRGTALMYTTLLLPMMMSQFASLSQDALIISLSLFVVAQASRLIDEGRPATTREFAFFAAIVAATVMARPSHVGLGLLGIAYVGIRDALLWRKVAITIAAAGCAAVWMAILSVNLLKPPPGASIQGQLSEMIADPLLLPRAMLGSLQIKGDEVYQTLVGRFGWIDAVMPGWYYRLAPLALIAAVFAPSNRPPVWYPAALGFAGFAVMTTLVCAALYITWAQVRHPYVETLQGRYILPGVPLLGWIMPPYAPRVARFTAWLWAVVLLFPLVSLTPVPGALMVRYYGSWEQMHLVLRTLFLG
jgi:uncharacterized membrane protein